MATRVLKTAIALLLCYEVYGNPVVKDNDQKSGSKLTLAEAEKSVISPLSEYGKATNQPTWDFSQMVETKEEDIPDGTWVLQVDDPLPTKDTDETLQTASNIVFRPLFRYREKQSNRRVSAARRRYYVPRRSYRNTYNYYRPYRSVQSYHYPYRYYGYWG